MLKEKGASSSLEDRRWFAKEAFAVSSGYDSAIFNYFDGDEASAFRYAGIMPRLFDMVKILIRKESSTVISRKCSINFMERKFPITIYWT